MTTNKPEVVSIYNITTGASEEVVLLADYQRLQAECNRLTDALESIARPVAHLKRHMGEDEELVPGVAQQLAKDPYYLQALAVAALDVHPDKGAPTNE